MRISVGAFIPAAPFQAIASRASRRSPAGSGPTHRQNTTPGGCMRQPDKHGSNMSIIFNDTQLVLLSAASQRDDHCLVPPAGPKRGQAQRAVAKLLEAGLVKEIRAKAGAPIWRRDDESGQTYALKLTAAGAKAIAVDETWPSEGEAERRANHPISVNPKPEPVSDPAGIDR